MKVYLGTALTLALITIASTSLASEREVLDLVVTCDNATYLVDFYGPTGSDSNTVSYVELKNKVGRDTTRNVTSMSCVRNPTPRPTDASEWVSHGCFDTKDIDGGIYSVSLILDASDAIHAHIERVTSRGAATLANLDCQLP